MATTSLFRGAPLLRLRLCHHPLTTGGLSSFKLLWSKVAESDSDGLEEKSSSADKTTVGLSVRDPPKFAGWDDSDFRKWKDKEAEILDDIEPVVSLTKEILHSDRYLDGERLNGADEKVVTEKLLAYHPNAEDKISCGIDSIMVDRHPQFRNSRCLFVVRTDGGWIDFSYQKCLRAYIREKYPSYAERFIREHFKRGS